MQNVVNICAEAFSFMWTCHPEFSCFAAPGLDNHQTVQYKAKENEK